MEKKKKTEVATNVSSGAEKVEKVEKTLKTVKEPRATKSAQSVESAQEKAKKESEAAKARVERAMQAKEKKARKQAARKKAAEEKAAAKKAKAEQRAAEKERARRERAHAKANKRQEKARKKKEKPQRERRERGYGGWLAAVIALGAVTLGLTTAVTVGAMEMSDMNGTMLSGHRATTYELVGIAQHVDDDLDRVRVSASQAQQENILTDLLVQARLAEADLERLPVCAESNCHLTEFFNRVARESERMLAKLRHGEPLNQQDAEILQLMYQRAHAVTEELNTSTGMMTDEDFTAWMKKGEGAMQDLFRRLEDAALPENKQPMTGIMPKMDGAGKERTPIQAENNESAITPAQAEELCKKYFSDYKIDGFECIGETVARGYTAYNVQGYDDNGTLLFAELDYHNGDLIRFDYYEPCNAENFDLANAQTLADTFLAKLGYDGVTAVRARENGTDVDFTYVYEQDGVAYYPDSVHVKVCRTRGVVTGFDASHYIRRHGNRTDIKFDISQETAESKLRDGVTVETVRAALVQTPRGERAAYEFVCAYENERYVIYVDANSGEELSIINIRYLG